MSVSEENNWGGDNGKSTDDSRVGKSSGELGGGMNLDDLDLHVFHTLTTATIT